MVRDLIVDFTAARLNRARARCRHVYSRPASTTRLGTVRKQAKRNSLCMRWANEARAACPVCPHRASGRRRIEPVACGDDRARDGRPARSRPVIPSLHTFSREVLCVGSVEFDAAHPVGDVIQRRKARFDSSYDVDFVNPRCPVTSL